MDNNVSSFMDRIEKLASTGGSRAITRDDIRKCFDDMDLSSEQMEQIVTYLSQSGAEVAGEDHTGMIDSQADYDLEDLSLPDDVKDTGAMKIYMSQLAEISVLNEDEEDKLASEAASGIPGSAEELIEHDMRLVFAIVKEYCSGRSHMNFYDLIQEGNIGLMKAAVKYDPSRGIKFRRYASYWIRQAVMKAQAQSDMDSDFSSDVADTLNRIKDAADKIENDTGIRPSAEDVARYLNMPAGKVLQALDFSNDGINLRQSSEIADTEDVSEEKKRDIENVLNDMRPFEKAILTMRLGLDGHVPRSSEDTARMYGISKDHINQIQAKALMLSRRKKAHGSV